MSPRIVLFRLETLRAAKMDKNYYCKQHHTYIAEGRKILILSPSVYNIVSLKFKSRVIWLAKYQLFQVDMITNTRLLRTSILVLPLSPSDSIQLTSTMYVLNCASYLVEAFPRWLWWHIHAPALTLLSLTTTWLMIIQLVKHQLFRSSGQYFRVLPLSISESVNINPFHICASFLVETFRRWLRGHIHLLGLGLLSWSRVGSYSWPSVRFRSGTITDDITAKCFHQYFRVKHHLCS